MNNKFLLSGLISLILIGTVNVWADPNVTQNSATIGSVWGHPMTAGAGASLFRDSTAHAVGDLVTIVVDLQNQVSTSQNTTTSKTSAVTALLTSLIYPNNGTSNGYNFLNNQGQGINPTWNGSQSSNGGGTIANQLSLSSTIQARVVAVEPNGVLKIEAVRVSKAAEEDTSMILSGLVRPEDLSTTNSISSSHVADLQILQKGKGTLTNNQSKGWLTKLYEFLTPF